MSEISQEIIDQAIEMGWQPLDKFKGRAEKWVDADEYVERGERIVPILNATNRRLREDLLTANQKIGNLENKVETTNKALDRLEKHYTEANKRAVENAKIQLREELRAARDSGDIEAEDTILGKLEDIRNTEREAAAAAQAAEEKKTTTTANPIDEATQRWTEKNKDWYGVDKVKTKNYLRLAEDLRDEGNTETGDAFYKTLDKAYAERYELSDGESEAEEDHTTRASKVEGSNPQNRNPRAKSFASLPAEAKAACHEDIDLFVGEGKKYKTVKDWETQYAKIYYGEG